MEDANKTVERRVGEKVVPPPRQDRVEERLSLARLVELNPRLLPEDRPALLVNGRPSHLGLPTSRRRRRCVRQESLPQIRRSSLLVQPVLGQHPDVDGRSVRRSLAVARVRVRLDLRLRLLLVVLRRLVRVSEVRLHVGMGDTKEEGDEEAEEGLDASSFRCTRPTLISIKEGEAQLEDVEEDVAVGHAQLVLVERSEDGPAVEVEALLLLVASESLDLGRERLRRRRDLLVGRLERDGLVVESAVEVFGVLRFDPRSVANSRGEKRRDSRLLSRPCSTPALHASTPRPSA